MEKDDVFKKYKINPEINKDKPATTTSEDPYFDELQGLLNKMHKLITLELVKSDNVRLKRGLLNTIILDCKKIKNEHLELEEGEKHFEDFN